MLTTLLFRHARRAYSIAAAMESGHDEDARPTIISFHHRRWWHSLTRGIAWEREWAGLIK